MELMSRLTNLNLQLQKRDLLVHEMYGYMSGQQYIFKRNCGNVTPGDQTNGYQHICDCHRRP